jgi:hypothetical protein
MNPAIIVMVKAPLPGFAKTRLALSEAAASSLALCFLQDVVSAARRIVPNLIVAFTPRDGRAFLQNHLPDNLLWIEQSGDGLGERMDSAIAHATKLDFNPVIVLGADSPTLPLAFIEDAIQSLAEGDADVVLGPTTDGGYYLVGLRKPVADLFRNVEWSRPTVFEQTVRNINELNLKLTLLPEWYDVDTPDDLVRLRHELNSSEQARNLAPATHRWLEDN